MNKAKATRVLKRFDYTTRRVAAQVAEQFPSVTTAEDAEQDARILVMSYAGLVPGGRHAGSLDTISADVGHDESRIHGVVATQLRLGLSEQYGREVRKSVPTQSLDGTPENKIMPIELDNSVSEREWLRRFPHLAARILYGLTEEEMAESEGKSRPTIARRIAKEKRDFLVEYVKRAGLVVEGDEPVNELQEAYGYLKAAGR